MSNSDGRVMIDPEKGANKGVIIFLIAVAVIIIIFYIAVNGTQEENPVEPTPVEQTVPQ
ncbi:MAG: hypothetical protein PHZ04_00475 [Patescibacteria group bacterium]|nr:hypothetical protein [Patescibacteria group bacterium]MDD5294764.1 hypothetical protein [Patescibacteria group bacterium]MDD5554759.1 hypothetical protein [Patescibacteria group bacterium]